LERTLGRRPVGAQESRIAAILASIGEGDYGEITRLRLDFSGGESEALVSKRVRPKDERNVKRGAVHLAEHRRFLKSFVVEVAAYRELARPLAAAGLTIPRTFLLPSPQVGEPFILLMEDLSQKYPRGANGKVRQMVRRETRAALRWLAGFHAAFWEAPRAEERGLFKRGSYWILDELGRLELDAVADSYKNRYINNFEWRRLRAAAPAIDARLAGRRAAGGPDEPPSGRHRTLVHGDAKEENILCSAVSPGGRDAADMECAGIDFSWAGEGYGMYDVMYLLWGEMADNMVDEHLQHYYNELLERLPRHLRTAYTPQVARKHFELCVLDFMRWWSGYREGGHFWAMPWAIDIMRKALDRLDGGRLQEEAAYAAAVDRVYPLD